MRPSEIGTRAKASPAIRNRMIAPLNENSRMLKLVGELNLIVFVGASVIQE